MVVSFRDFLLCSSNVVGDRGGKVRRKIFCKTCSESGKFRSHFFQVRNKYSRSRVVWGKANFISLPVSFITNDSKSYFSLKLTLLGENLACDSWIVRTLDCARYGRAAGIIQNLPGRPGDNSPCSPSANVQCVQTAVHLFRQTAAAP